MAVVQPLERRVLLDGAQLEPPRFLLGDVDPAPVGGSETEMQVAGGGGGFLAVWVDNRSAIGSERQSPLNAGWPGGGTGSDIFAARLDAAGQLVGTSFALYMGPRADTQPRVDFNGTHFLVSWIRVLDDDPYGRQVVAQRFGADGRPVDPQPLVIATHTPEQQLGYNCGITHDAGGNWLVVFGGWDGDDNALFGKRIGAGGTLLDAAPRALMSGASASDEVFFVNGQYGIVATPNYTPTFWRRFDANLNFLGETVLTRGGHIASNGDSLYMTWGDYVGTETFAAFGSRLSATGTLLDGPEGVRLTAPQTMTAAPRVAWDGANWAVTTRFATHNAVVTRVSPAGAVLNGNGTTIASSPLNLQAHESAAANGTVVSLFVDQSGPGFLVQDISAAALRADNSVTPRSVVSQAPRNQMNVDLATGPGGFLAVYKDMQSGTNRVLAQRLNTAGVAIDDEPIVLDSSAPDRLVFSPRVAFNGSVYTVVWWEAGIGSGTGGGGTYFRRLDAAGNLLDPAPRFLAPDLLPEIAASGDQFLIVSHHQITTHQGFTRWWRMNSAGDILANANLNYIAYPRTRALDVVAVGDRWLVAWQAHVTFNEPRAIVLTAFVDRAGNQTSAVEVSYPLGYAPQLASSGNNALLVFDQKTDGSYQDIWGRILNLDGTFGPLIHISNAENSTQSEPHVAWNGSEYVVAWIDHRDKQYPLQPEGDIYAARVSETGVLLDPQGVPVANSDAPDDAPTVNFGHGITLLGYSTFNNALSVGSMRVAVREIFAPLAAEAADYAFDRDPHVGLDFTADVSESFTTDDVQLLNLTTGATVPSSSLAIAHDTWHDAASIRYADGIALPDGTYRLTIPAGAITSATNQPLTEDLVVNFFVLAGDANRDRVVDITDLGILATNWQGTGRTFSQGDFNYDGTVDITDLGILASKWQQAVPAPAARAAPTPFAATRPRRAVELLDDAPVD
jgi:hypothetical protein